MIAFANPCRSHVIRLIGGEHDGALVELEYPPTVLLVDDEEYHLRCCRDEDGWLYPAYIEASYEWNPIRGRGAN